MKNEKKVFTKNEVKDIMKKNYNPFDVNYRICKRRDVLCNMENIVLKETFFIAEEKYQQVKKTMGKTEDYFTQKELEKLT